MAIPIDLNNALENQLNQIINMQNINEKAKSISDRYRKNGAEDPAAGISGLCPPEFTQPVESDRYRGKGRIHYQSGSKIWNKKRTLEKGS